jgi:pyruvate formate lyase activating enzyme
MPIYKITYAEEHARAHLYNWGCSFRCRGCAYHLRDDQPPARTLSQGEIRDTLRALPTLRQVNFLGGEPTTNRELPALLALCKQDLGVRTWLGHTNGTALITENLDGLNISLKAYSPALHLEYTGYPRDPIHQNLRRAWEAGLEIKAGAVLIPDYVDAEEIRALAAFVASLSPDIPFHLSAFMEVPGLPWRPPTASELAEAVAAARESLHNVSCSALTAQEYLRERATGGLYHSVQVA